MNLKVFMCFAEISVANRKWTIANVSICLSPSLFHHFFNDDKGCYLMLSFISVPYQNRITWHGITTDSLRDSSAYELWVLCCWLHILAKSDVFGYDNFCQFALVSSDYKIISAESDKRAPLAVKKCHCTASRAASFCIYYVFVGLCDASNIFNVMWLRLLFSSYCHTYWLI